MIFCVPTQSNNNCNFPLDSHRLFLWCIHRFSVLTSAVEIIFRRTSFLIRELQLIKKDFTAIADVCFREFGDRVLHWTTVNEANVFAIGCYDQGLTPPGRCSPPFANVCSTGHTKRLLDPLIFGEYPEIIRKNAGTRIPAFTKAESKQIMDTTTKQLLLSRTIPISLQPDDRDLIADLAIDLQKKESEDTSQWSLGRHCKG